MRANADRKPAWWSLYGIAASLLAVIGLIDVYVEPGLPRQLLEIVSVVTAFAVIWVWLRSNRIALDLARERRRRPPS